MTKEYSKLKLLRHLRAKRDLRLLEPFVLDVEERLTALEEKTRKRPVGRPRKQKTEDGYA